VLLLSEEHGVQGMLAKRLSEFGFAEVPGDARERLQARMRAQHLFTLGLTAELFRVLEDFSKAGIDAIPVKGPVISLLAYDDPALRSYGDLDLLLRHKDIQPAIRRMLAMGFEPDLSVTVVQSQKVPGEYLFRRPGTQRLVELHTEQTFRHYPKPMRIEEMLTRRRPVVLDGRAVQVLSLEDEIVFDCIHGAKDFWERLMWVSDVAALLTKNPGIDWQKVRQNASVVNAHRMLHTGVQLAVITFGTPIPDDIAEAIQQDAPAGILCEKIRNWLPHAGHHPLSLTARAIYRMKMAGGGIAGARYLARLSFSPTEDDWEEAGAATRRSRLWEAVRRPFRLIRKYGAGE